MTGMGGAPLTTSNSTIVSAFQSSLLHQLLIVLVILAALAIAWNVLRGVQLRRAIAERQEGSLEIDTLAAPPEPVARRILRISFGLIWTFDGILQAQAAMPVGLTTQVTQPAAATSPDWVRHLVNAGALIWNNHPVEAAVSTVWIQVGIGVWLLVARRGPWSRAGALLSVGWGLLVWGFGEAFGQIFAPGLTILFGAPGAVLLYCVAGGLVALPERSWSSPRLGRLVLFGMGLFLIGMAVLQAWPGRGFWQGAVKGHPAGPVVSMVDTMSGTSQPSFLSSWLSSFGSFDASHGVAVNLFVVIVLFSIGLAFCSGRRPLVRIGVLASWVFCLADWVLVEDFGFLGGVGTDPNSMIPIALVFTAGYVAVTRVPALATITTASPITRHAVLERFKLDPSYAFRSLAAAGAALVVLLGATPMAFASMNPNADPIVTEATNGTPDVTNTPAPGFTLTDQNGRIVSLASLRGKTLALTFLDPVCTTACPLIGQEFREADEHLGSAARGTEFIAIVANPLYRSAFVTQAFDRQEGLDQLSNWLYLTGSLRQLSNVWQDYGVQVTVAPAGAMIDHTEIAYVIDARGHTRYILSTDPGAGTSTTKSSFVDLLDSEISHLRSAS